VTSGDTVRLTVAQATVRFLAAQRSERDGVEHRLFAGCFASGIDEFRAALAEAKRHEGGPVLVHVETDPLVPAPSSESWWDVPVAEVSQLDSTRQARKSYEASKAGQRPYL